MATIIDEDNTYSLTDKQMSFCQEYIIDMNAKQSAIRAGYSEDTAQEQGSRLLSKVKAKLYIKQLLEDHKDHIDITQAEVIAGIKKIAMDETINPNVRVNAFAKLGQYLNLFDKPAQIVINNNTSELSIEEIERQLAELNKFTTVTK